jgi:long-chain fatty acid transport protein
MKRVVVGAAIALAAVAWHPAGVSAQGFALYESSACSVGRAGAGVASPCADGSAMVYNPAGLVKTGRKLSLGALGVIPSGTYVNDVTGLASNLESNIYPAPSAFFSRPIGDRFAVGLGVYAPFGLATNWDPNTAQGRFIAYRTELSTITAQPTIAAKFGPVSVGAGLDIRYLDVRLQRRLDLSSQSPNGLVTFGQLGVPKFTDFADAVIEGSGWGVGVNLGVLVDVVKDRVQVGGRYVSRQKITQDEGTARFSQVATGLILPVGNPLSPTNVLPLDAVVRPQFAPGGPLTTQSVATAIRLPEIAVVGVAVTPVAPLTLMVDAQWTGWSVFTEVPLQFERLGDQTLVQNYVDTWSYRVGGEYAFGGPSDVRLRAGWLYNEAATPDETVTASLPENERNVFSLGAGVRLSSVLSADVGYMYVDQADRRGRSFDVNDGLYRGFNAHLLSLSFSFDY